MIQTARLFGVFCLLTLVTACASSPPAASGGRYSIQQDRAPSRQIRPEEVPEVVPEPIVRTQAGNKSPYTVLGRTYTVLPTEAGYKARGVASWYGEKFHGHRTSNGEVFDMYLASAAHKSLPIPSFLKVTNLDNNRSLVVRVNDRGPFHGDRLIDLSYGAALKLGFAERGTARVELEAIVPPARGGEIVSAPARVAATTSVALATPSNTYLQVGAFAERRAAEELSVQIQRMTDLPVFISPGVTRDNQPVHRVRVGPSADGTALQRLRERVVAANLGTPYTVAD